MAHKYMIFNSRFNTRCSFSGIEIKKGEEFIWLPKNKGFKSRSVSVKSPKGQEILQSADWTRLIKKTETPINQTVKTPEPVEAIASIFTSTQTIPDNSQTVHKPKRGHGRPVRICTLEELSTALRSGSTLVAYFSSKK